MANPSAAIVAIAVDNDANATNTSPEERRQGLRMIEALIFAAAEPVSADDLAARLPQVTDIGGLLKELQQTYQSGGVNLVQVAGKWTFRTAGDLFLEMIRLIDLHG